MKNESRRVQARAVPSAERKKVNENLPMILRSGVRGSISGIVAESTRSALQRCGLIVPIKNLRSHSIRPLRARAPMC